MNERPCLRDFQHAEHYFVDGHGGGYRCPGVHGPSRSAAELVATQPALVGVGTVPAINELGVMCA